MKKWLLCIPLLFTIVGCSAKEQTVSSGEKGSSTPPTMESVEVSIYRSGSPKAQPELLNMYTDKNAPETLKAFSTWIQGNNSQVNIDVTKTDKFYLVQVDYDNKTYKYFLCVQTKENQYYFKLIQDNQVQKVNLDKYEPGQNDFLIQIAGKDGWLGTKEIPQ